MSGALLRFVKKAAFALQVMGVRLLSRLRPAKIFVYHLDPALGRKCEALVYTLKQRGINAERVCTLERSSRRLLAATSDLWIGLWNSVPLEHLPAQYIFWNGEPTNHQGWGEKQDWSATAQPSVQQRWHENTKMRSNWVEAAQRSLAVWGYTRGCEAFASQAGKSFHFVPFGYSAYYEQVFDEVTGGQRPELDIDVLFYAWTSERRQRVLDELKSLGVKVRVINQHDPVRGEDLERLIARAKIVLGIFGYDDEHTHVPDFARFDFVFSNRIFALHEKPSAVGRDEDFEAHVPVSDYAHLATECVRYLADDSLRERCAQRTYDWFKECYAYDSFVPFDVVRSLR
jgi:hypothetical protein